MNVIDYSVPVEDLVSAVKNAVKQAGISATDVGRRDLRVGSVQLTLSAVVTTKLGGGLDFRVPVIGWKVKVGGSRSRQKTHTIDITLVAEDHQDQHELRNDAVEESLVEAITTIRAVVAIGTGGDDPLVLKTSTVEIVFGITDQGTISVGAEGELTDEVTNTLRIELLSARAG
ncbi:trypco2 family protein [Micromonospora sp. NPDC047557]|uniref:trypco2 family protein n=1 Tax=Micromonospora sp. NPDC047557 TaxID=3364250 RepID=UPI00371D1570